MLEWYQNECWDCHKLFETPNKRRFTCPTCMLITSEKLKLEAQMLKDLSDLTEVVRSTIDKLSKVYQEDPFKLIRRFKDELGGE